MEFEKMQALLKSRLNPKRFDHVMGVVESAEILARRFGVDENKARTAALLHDCGRQFKSHELIAEARRRNLPISLLEKQLPVLLHAKIGSIIAKEEYGIEDPEILKAIEAHTVGAAKMNALDKIIYLADMIEKNRSFDGLDEIRYAALHDDLDEVMVCAFDHSIEFIIRKGHTIHPYTVAARNFILLEKGPKINESRHLKEKEASKA